MQHLLPLLLSLLLLLLLVAAQEQRPIGPTHVWVELFDNGGFRGDAYRGMVLTKLCHGVGARRGRVSPLLHASSPLPSHR
jgi:hypothetical protein